MEKKILVVGLTALLVLGLVVVVNATEGMRGMNKTALIENLGLPEDASSEEIRNAIWQKRLSDLGLTDNSTVGEFREAMKAKMQERHQGMLEKLGLSEDATPQEIREARKAYCEENPDDCPCKKKAGFGRGFRRHVI